MIYPAVRFHRSDTEVIRNKCHFTEYHMTLSRGRGFKNQLCLLCERIYYLIKPNCVYIFKLPDEVFTHLERNFVFRWVLELHTNRIFDKKAIYFLGNDFLKAQWNVKSHINNSYFHIQWSIYGTINLGLRV